MMRRALGARGASNIIKVCPQNVIFQRRAWAGSGTDDRSAEGTKQCSIWERRDEGLRAGIPLGRPWRERGGKRKVMQGWWSQPASFSSPAIKLNPPWSPHQSRWLLLASEKGWWHERREGIEKGAGAIDNRCLFISQNRTATKEQRTISGCYASLICFLVWFFFLALAVDNHWWRLLLQSIKSDKCHQNINNYGKLVFFFFFFKVMKSS